MTKHKHKSTRKATHRKRPTPETAIAEAKPGRRLIITIPVLLAVLFSIAYLQIGIQPTINKASALPGHKNTKTTLNPAASALPIAPNTAESLQPLSVVITKTTLNNPPASGMGDTNASAAAQPTVNSLQAPIYTAPSDGDGIQAPRSPAELNDLINSL